MSSQDNMQAATDYYESIKQKDFKAMASYIHEDIHLVSPMGESKGKEQALEATKMFSSMILDLQITSKFSNDQQAMIAYESTLPDPIGKIKSASLITFKDGKIIKLELFYDSKPFEMFQSMTK